MATTSSKQQDDSDDDKDLTPIKAGRSKRSLVIHLSDKLLDEDLGVARTKPSRATKMSTDSLLDSPEPQVGRTKKQQLQTKKKIVPKQKQTLATALQKWKTKKRPKCELSDKSLDKVVQNAMQKLLDNTPEPKKKPRASMTFRNSSTQKHL
jgi:hypothetical protein